MHRDIVTADQLRRLLAEAQERALPAEVTEKLRWFLHYTENRCPVEETCAAFQISRATFHRWAKRFDVSDLSSLVEKSRRPKSALAHVTDTRVVRLIDGLRREQPFLGKEDIARRVTETLGSPVSPSTVGRIIAEHGLYFGETPMHRRKRAAYADRSAPTASPTPAPETTATEPATPPTESAQEAIPFRRPELRALVMRALLLGSLAANLLFAGFLLGTASWEKQNAALLEDMRTRAEYREALSVSTGSVIAQPEIDPETLDGSPDSPRP